MMLVTMVVLTGCAAPKPSLDHVPIAEAQRLPDSYGAPAPPNAADADMTRWWRRFGDPTLVMLAERTLAANQDIAQAAARIAEASADNRAAAAQRLPTLGVSAATVAFGQPLTLTASVPSGATGTVSFLDGATALGSATIAGGAAALTTATLGVGSHSVTASYGGDGNFLGSVSSGKSVTVAAGLSSVALLSTQNPSTTGQSVTFTATVSGGAASGTVTFKDGGTDVGTGSLSGNVATFTTASLSLGDHSITAVYPGDGNLTGSTSAPVTQTVNQAATTTAVAPSDNPSVLGQSVTFTATVSVTSPASGTPSGTVTFYDGLASIGTGSLSSDTATFSTAALSVGNHTITAVYAGDANFVGSTSSGVTQTGVKTEAGFERVKPNCLPSSTACTARSDTSLTSMTSSIFAAATSRDAPYGT